MSPSASIPEVPGPWHLEGEVYWMILKPLDKLPPAAYAPLEEPTWDDPTVKTNRYLGGLGTVWVVRYTASPVGPYDELIYAPGEFTTPSGGRAPRVTRIYVSTAISVFNGRHNWNIPKHLARFRFTKQKHGGTLIEVFDPEEPEAGSPFFAAVATPQRFLPALPFTTRWVHSGETPQPPLPTGPPERPEEVGSEDWIGFTQETKGRIKIAWWEPAPVRAGSRIPPGEYTDGVQFPRLDIRCFGVWFVPGATIAFSKSLPVEGAS